MSKDASIPGVFLGPSPFLAAMAVLLMLFSDPALFIPRTMKWARILGPVPENSRGV